MCGINDGKIQRSLLLEKELILKRTWEIIVGMESADKYADDLQQPGAVNPVHVVKGQPQNSEKLCPRCGGKHKVTACPFKEAECHTCKKRGHIAKVCQTKLKKHDHGMPPKSEQTHRVDIQESEPVEYTLFKVSSHISEPLMVDVAVNGQSLQMELDTGASILLISEYQYKQLREASSLEKSSVILRTYTGENLLILGSIRVTATCNNQTKTLPILVIKGNGPNLMGHDWLAKFQLDWQNIFQLHSLSKIDKLLTKFESIFKDELGTVKDIKVHIQLNPNSEPKFHKAHTVPMALRQKVEEELNHLE